MRSKWGAEIRWRETFHSQFFTFFLDWAKKRLRHLIESVQSIAKDLLKGVIGRMDLSQVPHEILLWRAAEFAESAALSRQAFRRVKIQLDTRVELFRAARTLERSMGCCRGVTRRVRPAVRAQIGSTWKALATLWARMRLGSLFKKRRRTFKLWSFESHHIRIEKYLAVKDRMGFEDVWPLESDRWLAKVARKDGLFSLVAVFQVHLQLRFSSKCFFTLIAFQWASRRCSFQVACILVVLEPVRAPITLAAFLTQKAKNDIF